MEIRRIGTISVGPSNEWQVEATELSTTASGVGFAPFAPDRPRALRCSLVGRATTSYVLHQEIDKLAAQVLRYRRLRLDSKDFAPGVSLVFRDGTIPGGDAVSRLIEPELRVLSIERTSTDWIARVELSGLLLHPPLCMPPQFFTQTYTPYSAVPVTTVYQSGQMYTYNLEINLFGQPIRNCLVVVEDGSPATSITPIPITSVISGSGVFEAITATHQRWRLTAGSSAQLGYTITVNTPSLLVLPIYLPPATPSSAVCQVSSQLFSPITIPLVPSTSIYRTAVWDTWMPGLTYTVTLSNVVAGTAVYPIIPVPLEAITYYVNRVNVHTGAVYISTWDYHTLNYDRPFGVHRSFDQGSSFGTVYGPQASVVTTYAKMLVAFVHEYASLSSFSITTISYRISPSAFA